MTTTHAPSVYDRLRRAARTPTDLRFWSKVSLCSDPRCSCWHWIGGLSDTGYGGFWNGEKVEGAHRWVYRRFVEEPSIGLTLDHLCRNRWRVNFEHMEQVTRGENVLRGCGPTAENARKRHCNCGRPYTFARRGERVCRPCINEGRRINGRRIGGTR